MSSGASPRCLVVGCDAEAVRRSLGPLAWTALEVLFESSESIDGAVVARSSARCLADALGVAKNTAHRAIVALRRAGLIEPTQLRTPDGKFTRGAYRLSVAPSVLRLVEPQVVRSNSGRPSKRCSAPAAPPSPVQLSLLSSA